MSAPIDCTEKDDCVYEVNTSIANDLREDYRAWLDQHIREMLTLPGFEQAFVLELENPDDAELYHCTIHYVVANRQALQNYFDQHAERMRAQGSARFGAALSATRRILTTRNEYFGASTQVVAATTDQDAEDPQVLCLDCGTPLRGQYCYICGQRDQRKLVSLGELFTDLVHDLVSWDTRLWQTLRPLLTKPGHLTNAYLQGQRMRYSPPLRMYLIASILFFLVASVGPQMALRKMDVTAPIPMDDVQVDFGTRSATDKAPPLAEPMAAPGSDADADTTPTSDGQPQAGTPAVIASDDNELGKELGDDVTQQLSEAHAKCAEARNLTSPVYQDFMRERAFQICLRMTTREGLRNFGLEMLDNLPSTLLFLLPLMALVNKFFYLFSKRYYVEHLLFYVHNFSFLFVFSTLMLALGKVFEYLSLRYFGFITLLAVIYVIYYFLRAMRVVYRQSRTVTFIKWLVINFIFLGLATSTLGILALVTAAMVA